MPVASNGFLPLGIGRKPIACSYVFAPSLGTFFNCVRLEYKPFSSRYFTIFSATVFDNPATYCNNDADAVFAFTPTRFTAVSTTNDKESDNFFFWTSC